MTGRPSIGSMAFAVLLAVSAGGSWMSGVRPAAAAGLAAAGWSPTDERQAIPVAVFGKDERIVPPQRYTRLKEGIGVLFNMRTRTVCTAFCVDASIIATAAHCLFRTAGESPPRLQDYWYARNYDSNREYARIGGYDTGSAAQHIVAGGTSLSTSPPIDATRDWALAKLSRPLCQGHVLAVEPASAEAINAAAKAGQIFQLSYHRDYIQWRPAYSQPCAADRTFGGVGWPAIRQDFSQPDGLLLHTCDTGGASSGSPLLRETPQGPRVVGINVGTYVLSRVLTENGAVTRKLAADTIANTGVAAAVFAAALQQLRSAEILVGSKSVRELQAALRTRGYYTGPIDGTYGTGLKTGIENYERAVQRAPSGLATRALLNELSRVPQPDPKPASGGKLQ